jgi:glycosyltransferase involved in cell wall biosynthesis
VIHWLSPGDPARRTGGFLYNARVIAELQAAGHRTAPHRVRGHRVRVHRIDADWPLPSHPPPLPLLPHGARVVADGLLLTGMADALRSRPDLEVLALVHSPLEREGGGEEARGRERAALGACAHVVATSEATAAELRELTGQAVSVVVPGTDPATPAPVGPGHRLLCPAHLIARKGHRVLLDALRTLDALPETGALNATKKTHWTLDLVGSLSADPVTAAHVQAEAAALGPRVRLRGECDAAGMEAAYASADLVVLPSHYEAFGMVLTEAVARGRPVLCTPAGAVPLLGDAAQVVPVGDAAALADGLAHWLDDPELRARRRAAAMDAATTLPRWPAQAARLAACFSDSGHCRP